MSTALASAVVGHSTTMVCHSTALVQHQGHLQPLARETAWLPCNYREVPGGG